VNSPASPVPPSGSGSGGNGGSNLAAAVKELDPIAQLIATKKKILFVQDAKSLVIVSCDKHDTKNGFKVLVAAPLLYAGELFFLTAQACSVRSCLTGAYVDCSLQTRKWIPTTRTGSS
jgi:hypothetical protein